MFQYNYLCRFEKDEHNDSLNNNMVSIQLFVSVRVSDEKSISLLSRVSIQLFVSVRAFILSLVSCPYLGFNTTICVGSSRVITQQSWGMFLFQYNYLCRFESTQRAVRNGAGLVSIQLFVSVRGFFDLLCPQVLVCFNTTICVGSR